MPYKQYFLYYLFFHLCVLPFFACKHDNTVLKKQLVEYEKEMLKDTTGYLEKENALKFIGASLSLAEQIEPDTAAATLYFKAASVARSLSDYEKSIEIFGKVIDKFPNHEHAPLATFLTAFTYENDLRQGDKAKMFYNKLISKYPTHELAATARIVMEYFGKSPDELIKRYESSDTLAKSKILSNTKH